MPVHVKLERRGGGHVVVKHASDDEGKRRLRREHEALAGLHLPCVIRESEWLDDAFSCRLTTVFVDDAISLDELPGNLDIASTIAVVAATAAAVAELHAHGIAHGALVAEHVLMAPDGTIVLCSFGASTRATVEAVERDTAALSTLVGDLCAENPTGEPSAARLVRARLQDLLRSARSPGHPAAHLHAALIELEAEGLADVAADDALAPAAVPPPGALSPTASIVDGAEPPGDERGASMQPGDERDTPPVLRRASSAPDGTRTWHSRAVAAHAVDEPTSVGPRRTIVACAVVLACLWSSWSLTRAVTSGRRTGLDEVAGTGVEHEGHWFSTGDPDDLIAIADWRCDGAPAPLVYRPSTGEVFVFSARRSGGADGDRSDNPAGDNPAGDNPASDSPASDSPAELAWPDRLVTTPGALAVDRTADCGQVLLGFSEGSRVFPIGNLR